MPGTTAKRAARYRSFCSTVIILLVSAAFSTPGSAQELVIGAEVIAELNLTNFSTEGVTSIQHAPGRPDDIFVSILDGRIMRLDLTDNSVSTFATVPNVDLSSPSGFFGFLGFTFHPDFETNGQMFVHVADERFAEPGVHHRTYIRRFDITDHLSNTPTLGPATNILRWDQPGHDHNGGFLGFQPGDSNTLWIASGDGENNDGNPDPNRNGQDLTDLLGSILRIDVSGGDDFPADPNRNYTIPENNPFADSVGGLPEIWNYGIRSPWGPSFDRETGDFIWGDVGQVSREEINFERFGAEGGRNYGWRVMEGNLCANPGEGNPACGSEVFTAPIHDYEHSGGYGSGNSQQFEGRSVTGGYVYRGPIEELQGKYIFGDWSSRQIWAMEIDRDANDGLGAILPDSLIDLTEAFNQPLGANGNFLSGVTAFGEDTAGNLYFSQLNGALHKITLVEDCPGGCCPGDDCPPGTRPMKPTMIRDDFDTSHNYASGDVPAGSIWTGVHNEDFGDVFDANASNVGQLTFGLEPLGWQGNGEDNAPFLFREVNAESLLEVRVKISDQTRGNWSSAGILARLAGPLDNDEDNDHYLSAHSFRIGGTNSVQVSNVQGGAEGEDNIGVGDEDNLMFLRLVHNGNGQFDVFNSSDGEDWNLATSATNELLGSGLLEVGVWAGTYGAGIDDGDAQFDWVQILLGVPAGDYNEDGVINAADYTVWRNTLGQMVTPFSSADGDGDGEITPADYDIWRLNFGNTIPSLQAAGGAVVPEPGTFVALLWVCLLAGLRTRRVA